MYVVKLQIEVTGVCQCIHLSGSYIILVVTLYNQIYQSYKGDIF